MNIMQWINTNLVVVLALGIVWFAALAALYVFRNKMDISDTFFTAIAALAIFGAIITWGAGIVGWGYTKAKISVSVNPIIADVSAAIPGLNLTTYQAPVQQAAAPAAQAQAQQAAQAIAQPAQGDYPTAPLVQAPAPIKIMRRDAFTRWISTWPSGSPAGMDLITTGGGVSARSIPEGVYCVMLWGASAFTSAANEQWPAECHYNAEKATRNIGGTWGRHYFQDKADGITVTGIGEWPSIAYDLVTPADPQVSLSIPAQAPAVAAPAAVPAQAPAAAAPAAVPARPADPIPTQGVSAAPPAALNWMQRLQDAQATQAAFQSPTVTITVQEVTPTPAPLTHTVAPGDSLASIAKHYWNDREKWKFLCDLNSLPNCNILTPGQVIRIQ